MNKISWNTRKRNADLMSFHKQVQSTSKEAYQETEPNREKQMEVVEVLFQQAPNGLTDFELQLLLREFRIDIPLSTCSARRNDLNNKYVKEFNEEIIINIDNERRKNHHTNMSCLVWRWNQ